MKSFLSRLRQLAIIIPKWGYGDDERLAQIVYSTWTKLPLSDRRVLKAFWRSKNATRPARSTRGKLPLLTVELSADWAGRERSTVAEALLSGNTIRVLDAAFRRMPDDLAEVLVAHELMHLLREAKEQAIDDIDLEEELTRTDVEVLWGYPEESLTDWLEANVDDTENDLELL